MLLDGESWREVFDSFERDAWRFEAQPTYTMPKEAESLAGFLRGGARPDGHNTRWHQRVKSYVAAGKQIGRVRVVRRPLTDYQRYQFAWGIPGNIEAAEDIRVLDVTNEDYGLPLTGQDWWMFDDSRIVHLNFRPDGTQVNRELAEGPSISDYQHWRDICLAHAVPFDQYLSRGSR
ncbi:DUF6879 family protein [Kitasatospora viridis]|uniref:DUF6879 domain-containing protein n=1 Tax=Kitasatospora viridis TaxID=281105 RepID=A0A561UH89_9ACTN|nr:DUF6879 family protein [Kitasatospora viridis]TWF98728.1 hypothetical protein FHX73_112550 [Kitasatospora viridis]